MENSQNSGLFNNFAIVCNLFHLPSLLVCYTDQCHLILIIGFCFSVIFIFIHILPTQEAYSSHYNPEMSLCLEQNHE